VAGLGVGANGVAYLSGTQDDVSAVAATTAIYFNSTGGKAYLTNSIVKSGSSGQDVFYTSSSDVLTDLGGNQFKGSTHLSGPGSVYGASMIGGLVANLATCSASLKGQPATVTDSNTTVLG